MPHFIAARRLDAALGGLVAVSVDVADQADIGDTALTVIGHMLFLGRAEPAREIEMRGIVQGLVYEQ